MLKTFDRTDPHGTRKFTPVAMPRRERERLTRRRLHMFHKQKNGAYDSVTYYHVLEMLMHIEPGEVFRTKEFIKVLGGEVTGILWDAVTVGRIISDIAEALNEAYGFTIIGSNRRYDGMWFDVTAIDKGRIGMERLLEDLAKVAEAELKDEDRGVFIKRYQSPLEKCPSVILDDVGPMVRGATA